MTVILKPIRLAGSRGSTHVVTLFDNGATYSCIQPQLAERLGIPTPLPEPLDFATGEERPKIQVEQVVLLNFYLDGYRFSDEFVLIPNLSEAAIIGAATLQKWRMELDHEHDEVIFDPRVSHLRLSPKTAPPPPLTIVPEKAVPVPPPAIESRLPTFDLEVGWKYVYNPETGMHDQVPLTLLDVLYPLEDDGVIMPESPHHDLWTRWLAFMLETFLAARNWLILSDVFIHWGRRGVPVKAPDVAAIPRGHLPDTTEKSYRVHRDGPVPAFVLEITSEDTRVLDLQSKTLHYAAVGVREMLIVDFWTEDGGPWRLLGYRLEDNPYYCEIVPDPEGGLTFETIGLRFVAVGRERIDVYDVETSERLLTPDELKDYAEAEAARAEAEAAARAEAEARAAELETRLRELEARYQAQSGPTGDESR